MDKAYPLSTPMMVRYLDPKQDLFRPKKEDEQIFGLKIPCLNAIDALMYLAQCTRLDIVFFVNLLVRFNFEPTKRHLNSVKHTFCYHRRTINLGLFYFNALTKKSRS